MGIRIWVLLLGVVVGCGEVTSGIDAAGSADAGDVVDASSVDGATPVDSGQPDGAVADGAVPDAAVPDAMVPDAGPPDNIMFVTSTKQSGKLGGLSGADSLCMTRASAAGLSGTFRAWLSTSTVDANSRLGSASGWRRTDGKPFANDATGPIFYPPRIDEFGNDVGQGVAFTGTNANGTKQLGAMCSDWSLASGAGNSGGAYFTSVAWTSYLGGSDVCGSSRRIYCFQIDYGTDVTPTSTSTRYAFISNGTLASGGGTAAADSMCQGEADGKALAGTYKALLATKGTSAESRFTAGGSPWVRLDGVVIAPTAKSLFTLAMPDAPINLDLAGNYYGGYERVFVGVGASPATLQTPSTDADTCASWSSTDGAATGESGYAASTKFGFGVGASIPRSCTMALRVYCLRD